MPDLLAYVTTGREIATGYSTAMGTWDPSRDWQYLGLILVSAMIGWSIVRTTAGWRPASRLAVVLIVTGYCFLAYKQAFVRHSGGAFFEQAALIAIWVLPWTVADRERRTLILIALVIAALGVSRVNPVDLVNPRGLELALSQATILSSPDQRAAEVAAARSDLRARYAIPDSMLQALRGGSVHVDPYETAVMWAWPDLTWKPLPVMQTYSAYTEVLDEANAAALRGESAPDYILRSPPSSIDERQPFFESPLATLEIVCRYHEVEATDKWQLLRKGPTRCGSAEVLAISEMDAGKVVVVPAESRPDRLVIAHVDGIEDGLPAALRAFFDKSPAWLIQPDGGRLWRLVPETASGPLILASPASLGWTEKYRPPMSIGSFTVLMEGPKSPQPDVRLTIRFESVPFRPVP